MRNTRKGFTLVELLVVIAILAILATVSVVGYTQYITNANQTVVEDALTKASKEALNQDILGVGNQDGILDKNEVVAALEEVFGEGYDKVVSIETDGDTIVSVTYTKGKAAAKWTIATNKVEKAEPVEVAPVVPDHTCADSDNDFVCDTEGCNEVVEPAADSALTIAQAIALANLLDEDASTTNSYSVSGVVANVSNNTYGNMTITDGTNTFTIYGTTGYDSLEAKPVKGDTVTYYGQILNYSGTIPEIKDGTLTNIVVHGDNHVYEGGVCTLCGEVEPVAGKITTTYDFSTITDSVQYAEETHTLDENTTLYIIKCHINTELRIYSSDTNNGIAIVNSTKDITSVSFNAGKNADTLNVYGSNDNGVTWTLIEGVVVTSTYTDYTVDFNGATYTSLKFDVDGTSQVRLKTMTLTVQE